MADADTQVQPTPEDEQANVDFDARVVPVVKKFYELVAALPDPRTGLTAKDGKARADMYGEVSSQLVDAMLEHKLCLDDVKTLFQMVKLPVAIVQDILEQRLENFGKDATARLFGREFYDEITLNDVHEVLTGNYPSPYQKGGEQTK